MYSLDLRVQGVDDSILFSSFNKHLGQGSFVIIIQSYFLKKLQKLIHSQEIFLFAVSKNKMNTTLKLCIHILYNNKISHRTKAA